MIENLKHMDGNAYHQIGVGLQIQRICMYMYIDNKNNPECLPRNGLLDNFKAILNLTPWRGYPPRPAYAYNSDI